MEKIYLKKLNELRDVMNGADPQSRYAAWAKVVCLVNMNMRYEKIAFDTTISTHPYILTDDIVSDTIANFKNLLEISFIENKEILLIDKKSSQKEDKHQELFNQIWDRYNEKEFDEYVARYTHRIGVNALEPLVEGKKVIDFGCGNGVFCFAALKKGALETCGIDFGENSVKFAQNVAKSKNLENAHFKVATVYETGYEDDYFDFAIQNGVFHHLDDENKAIKEAARVLKKGGYFWYYTEGEGGISYDLWDMSVDILKEVPSTFIEEVLNSINISRNKIAHIMDGLSATYAHTSWNEMTNRLSMFGFGNFKRLTGGTSTDCDLDAIQKDPFGKEKFGEGDLRILCQLLGK